MNSVGTPENATNASERLPSQLIAPESRAITWLVDAAAAGMRA